MSRFQQDLDNALKARRDQEESRAAAERAKAELIVKAGAFFNETLIPLLDEALASLKAQYPSAGYHKKSETVITAFANGATFTFEADPEGSRVKVWKGDDPSMSVFAMTAARAEEEVRKFVIEAVWEGHPPVEPVEY